MADLAVGLIALAGMSWVAVRAFRSPEGVFRRSPMGFGLAVAGAAGLWAIGGPFMAAEAGFGAFVLFLAVAVISALVAAIASGAAGLRYLLDALRRP